MRFEIGNDRDYESCKLLNERLNNPSPNSKVLSYSYHTYEIKPTSICAEALPIILFADKFERLTYKSTRGESDLATLVIIGSVGGVKCVETHYVRKDAELDIVIGNPVESLIEELEEIEKHYES